MSTDPDPPRELGRLPITFSIVGVQKGATSTIHKRLSQHRLVAPTYANDPRRADRRWHFAGKELHFFDDEAQDWSSPDYSHYYGTKIVKHQKIAGDATPSYIMWPHALERMRRYNPDMKLIASFRDPIERAFSQWQMGRKQRNAYPEFSDAVEQYDDESMLDRVPSGAGRWSVHRRSMVIRGLYGAQLERGLAQFDRSQWLLITFADWLGDYHEVLDDVTDFLGIHRFRKYPPHRHEPAGDPLTGTPPSEGDIIRLVERYADDLTLFERLSGIDVSAWSTRRIARGEMEASELVDRFAKKFAAPPQRVVTPPLRDDELPISFSIVGVQKAATSTLHTMVVRHRHIARGHAKELHFFDDERFDWSVPDYRHYVVRRTHPDQQIAGEATPSYLFWPHALERMHAYNPDMRLIASFRDPIERAFSQWSMERKRQPSYPSFSESIRIFGDLSLLSGLPPRSSSREVRASAMVVRGLYGAQLRRGLSVYDRSQWLLLPFRRFVSDPHDVLDDVAAFLGVGPWLKYPKLRKNPTPRDQVGAPPTADDMSRLAEIYAADLAEFAQLSGFDVTDWPTSRIAAGTLDAADLAADLARKVGLVPED